MDIAGFALDIAGFETTTAHMAIFKGFFGGRGIATAPLLEEVSWDSFFGACHFCSIEIMDLADFPQKLPEEKCFL